MNYNNAIPDEEAVSDTGLHDFIKSKSNLSLAKRSMSFDHFLQDLERLHQHSYYRQVVSEADREVTVRDPYTHELRQMLMFASNNYLGLANHPYVAEKVKAAIKTYGTGVGGPPLLNGYTKLMKELEERIAVLKDQESAMIFSTGFSANLGLTSTLAQKGDLVLFDELSHASFYDSLHLTDAQTKKFAHNDLSDLEEQLQKESAKYRDVFVSVEGVYSMDGDLTPLDKLIPLCKKYNAFCWVDDAHGTGVMGEHGRGTAEHFDVEPDLDIAMGTFSKTFAVTGGFLAGPREVIEYLRYFARSYMFSAALPPMSLAAVLAGIEIIEREPDLRFDLFTVVDYAKEKLRKFGFYSEPQAAIIALKVPKWLDIRKANNKIHQSGIFLNAIEYPAVPYHQERFRISFMAKHTRKDVDRLANCLEEVWQDKTCRRKGKEAAETQ